MNVKKYSFALGLVLDFLFQSKPWERKLKHTNKQNQQKPQNVNKVQKNSELA